MTGNVLLERLACHNLHPALRGHWIITLGHALSLTALAEVINAGFDHLEGVGEAGSCIQYSWRR